jgi:hypothetical protein
MKLVSLFEKKTCFGECILTFLRLKSFWFCYYSLTPIRNFLLLYTTIMLINKVNLFHIYTCAFAENRIRIVKHFQRPSFIVNKKISLRHFLYSLNTPT